MGVFSFLGWSWSDLRTRNGAKHRARHPAPSDSRRGWYLGGSGSRDAHFARCRSPLARRFGGHVCSEAVQAIAATFQRAARDDERRAGAVQNQAECVGGELLPVAIFPDGFVHAFSFRDFVGGESRLLRGMVVRSE